VLYDRYGTTPVATDLLYGVTPVVLAIIAHALVLLGRTAIKSVGLAAIGLAATPCCCSSWGRWRSWP
jgi:chromate transporter